MSIPRSRKMQYLRLLPNALKSGVIHDMPIIVASGPVIVEDNKVLLNQHGDTSFWKFCGGSVRDFSHGLAHAAQDRAKDEMGMAVEILNPAPFLLYTSKETDQGMIDVILVHFLARRTSDIHPREDIRAWDWLPLDQLPPDLAPNILPTLRHFGFL